MPKSDGWYVLSRFNLPFLYVGNSRTHFIRDRCEQACTHKVCPLLGRVITYARVWGRGIQIEKTFGKH